MKISAADIVKNLVVDGVSVIPRGALVYLSTDDPKGTVCALDFDLCSKIFNGAS